jgi:hypothetical protein
VRTLVDQRLAGKKLALITNSDWPYTDTIMRYKETRRSRGENTHTNQEALSFSAALLFRDW